MQSVTLQSPDSLIQWLVISTNLRKRLYSQIGNLVCHDWWPIIISTTAFTKHMVQDNTMLCQHTSVFSYSLLNTGIETLFQYRYNFWLLGILFFLAPGHTCPSLGASLKCSWSKSLSQVLLWMFMWTSLIPSPPLLLWLVLLL